MHRITTSTLAALVATGTLVSIGCNSAPRRIDTVERITTLDLDVQDVETFSAQMTDQLLLSGFFANTPAPIRIKLEQFRNNTTKTNLTSDQILAPVRSKLLNSGKVQFFRGSTAGRRNSESGIVGDYQRIRETEAGQLSQGFDYVLNLTLAEDRARQGGTRQSTYILTMSLDNVNTGNLAYEDYRTIDKQN